jgi:hypothetical protein
VQDALGPPRLHGAASRALREVRADDAVEQRVDVEVVTKLGTVGGVVGFGAMTVMYSGWSLIARDPTRDHWALSVVGLILAISPWIGGYAGDTAAWVSWIGGLALMGLAGAAYIADESNEVTETERIKALVEYRIRHGDGPPTAARPRQQVALASRVDQSVVV